MWKLMKRLMISVAIGLCVFVAVIILRSNSEPWSKAEITKLTTGLNEAAAIGVPHDYLMDKATRSTHLPLLAKVEAGEVLSVQESLEYRKIFQGVLKANQAFLGRFDAELTPVPDHAMDMDNNIESHGIIGLHDHHDLSAHKNFAAMLQSLSKLDNASSVFTRIYYTNAAQKDLVDLISHLGIAPHTVSVPYMPPDQPWPDSQLGDQFEAMLKSFKSAQFEQINSTSYWAAVDAGLAHYDELIWNVQTKVVAKTTPWERQIAGRFLAIQTLAPPVDLARPLRRN